MWLSGSARRPDCMGQPEGLLSSDLDLSPANVGQAHCLISSGELTDSSKGKGERPGEFPSGADRTGRCFHTETQKKREKVERTPPNPPPRSTGPAKTKGHGAGASPIETRRGHFEMLMVQGFKQAAFTRV
ncbi:hypothetical protein KOW79_009453 [Hemibagrus wyckioides]|uniref:Uncharacterized protein n=1 Tax=Hemibagrus wyckioides TaxID=337641 RepID=A0A9D3SKY2_9TELE|nr:hypothetical protein KOW79_009453 [Hemibagrus wyckioides]